MRDEPPTTRANSRSRSHVCSRSESRPLLRLPRHPPPLPCGNPKTLAVAGAVAAVVTVAVAVAVAAAVAGGKCPSAPATTSARAPGPAPSSSSCGTPPPAHALPEGSDLSDYMAVYGNGPHIVPCPGHCAEQTERNLLHQATETWTGRDSYMASNALICPWGAMLRGRTPLCLVPDPLRPADTGVLESAATVKGPNRWNMDGER